MGRFIGPTCRKARRVGLNLDLKSSLGKKLSDKCKISVAPGQHGFKKKKMSDYGLQLAAKQSIKYMYGVFERQFRNYYRKSYKMRGFVGYNLLIFLECRLDNVVYRMGFASTRAEARQLVLHKFIYVKSFKNNFERIINIPSYSVNKLDKILLSKKCFSHTRVLCVLENSSNFIFNWVSVDKTHKMGTFLRFPTREELSSLINERLVVEYYSR